LLTEKYKYGDAASLFQDALKINPNSTRALIGLAVSKQFESNEAQLVLIYKALEVNSNFVPSLVARAPVIVTMQARLARLFAAEFGLSLSPLPVELREVTVSLLWHASYDNDPAHTWLRDLVVHLVAEL